MIKKFFHYKITSWRVHYFLLLRTIKMKKLNIFTFFIYSGLVVGLLKVGRKSLYVFDNHGETQNVTALCVLDFYVHESRQRLGLGRMLFDHMLQEEELRPEEMAIDRPSEKLLGFLHKHYGLTKKIPQMNNFVIYDGFFSGKLSSDIDGRRMHITARSVSYRI